ncbi:MAG: class I SAM-dependent methyltransferase [Gammaproteobacteria bacterium]|nr:class I SAM-dependent methyltransferase [Gammaproteobacteria bacterium]
MNASPNTAVLAKTPADKDLATSLATQFQLPLLQSQNSSARFLLNVENAELTLIDTGLRPHRTLSISFTSGKNAYRQRTGIGKKQPLGKALGLHKFQQPFVVDATAGLGSDAFVIACLGCRVLMIERNPVLSALLDQAVKHASNTVQNLSLCHGDALNILPQLSTQEPPHIVYLDPMFPQRTKSALVKKDMQILQALLGETTDQTHLLNLARAVATERVVVKRPTKALPLAKKTPTFSINGKTIRYDVYVQKV